MMPSKNQLSVTLESHAPRAAKWRETRRRGMGDGTGAHCPGAGEGTSTKLEWEKGHVIGKENSSIAQGGERKAQASAG